MTSTARGVALRLHGPLQAWGGATIGDNRPTLPFPTRSAVIGLVAACMGIRRSNVRALLELAEGTRVHVRVDAPGTTLVDDQTIQGNPNASDTRQTIQSKRDYLCDASFTAVLVPGPKGTLAKIASALESPVFAPYLGRRTCVPSVPLLLSREVLGADPIALFDGLALGPPELLAALDAQRALGRTDSSRIGEERAFDFYLDTTSHSDALRRIPLRDDLAGPLPRQWRERFALHVRARGPSTHGPKEAS
ncbi:MAG: type I-E CRISPR-associated protein Cas5/CasD [Polyangiaceae bacterium]